MAVSLVGLVWADRQEVAWAAKSSYRGSTRTAGRASVAFASSKSQRCALSATEGGRFVDGWCSRCRLDCGILRGRENDLAVALAAGGRSTLGAVVAESRSAYRASSPVASRDRVDSLRDPRNRFSRGPIAAGFRTRGTVRRRGRGKRNRGRDTHGSRTGCARQRRCRIRR